MIDIDRKVITSVGIDIGTTTSHLVFSEIILEKDPFMPSKKFRITERKVKYRGEIFFTPLKEGNREIDVEKLLPLLKGEYKRAGINPAEVDTGAVIVTGESARKENAEMIVEQLSRETGKFVAATAGPNFESVISAHGSGAVEYSRRVGCKLIHTDIGGGTSNIAVIEDGEILATGCMNVGGRLIAFDEGGVVTRLEPAGREILGALDLDLKLGDTINPDQVSDVASLLASSLIKVLTGRDLSDIADDLFMTEMLPHESFEDNPIYSFSGGVAEFIYGIEQKDFNDLGHKLGERIASLCKSERMELVEPSEKIRATVIGACEFTLQVSGSTTYRAPDFQLPIRNLPVVVVNINRDEMSVEHISNQVTRTLQRYDIVEGDVALALAFHNPVGIQYERLKTFSLGLVDALHRTIETGLPIILIFDTDVGNSVGNVLYRETGTRNVLSIDEISLREGDFIDIGESIIGNPVFPVVVKSLVFES